MKLRNTTTPEEEFGQSRNQGATALLGEALWHDGSGKLKPLAVSMKQISVYTKTGVLFTASAAGPFRTLNMGVWRIVDGYAVQLTPTDFTDAQLRAMPVLMPPSTDELALVFGLALTEMKNQPPIDTPNVPPVETPKGPFGSSKSARSSRRKVARS